MTKIVIEAEDVEFENGDGLLFCKGNLYDMAYLQSQMVAGTGKEDQQEVYTRVATAFKEKFRPDGKSIKYTDDISWGTAMRISMELQNRLGEQKKS